MESGSRSGSGPAAVLTGSRTEPGEDEPSGVREQNAPGLVWARGSLEAEGGQVDEDTHTGVQCLALHT